MRWHTKWQSFNQKDTAQLEDWARIHFTHKVQRKWKGLLLEQKNPTCWEGVSEQQPCQKPAGIYKRCQAAKQPAVHSLCSMGYSILHYVGRGCGKLTIPSDSMLWNVTGWLKIIIWIQALSPIFFKISTKYAMMSPNVKGQMQYQILHRTQRILPNKKLLYGASAWTFSFLI